MIFDPYYFLYIAPALLLAFVAQMWISAAYRRGQQAPAAMSGFAAARKILDAAGLNNVNIEPVGGHLSDHYDSRDKVLRLSEDVYHGRNLAAVGIAAHEAGHAIQDAVGYVPLIVRNMAVPAANFGTNISWLLIVGGLILSQPAIVWAGIILFSAFVIFQIVNLPEPGAGFN